MIPIPGRLRAYACVILFVLFSASLNAQSYRIVQSNFLPPQFYVGDTVELRLRIDAGDAVLPTVPDELPEAPWIDVREVRIIPIAGEYDIRIRFSSFRVGKQELPAIPLGEVTLEPVRFETLSIRDEGTAEPYGIFDPVYLPGTGLIVGIIGATVLFGPLLAILVFGWLRRAISRIAIGIRRPYKLLRRELDSLRGSVTRISSREYYQKLFDAFRTYLTDRTGVGYQSLTTRETIQRLRADFNDIEPIHRFAGMIDSVDLVKFGGGEVDHSRKIGELEIVEKSAEEIEEWFRKGVNG